MIYDALANASTYFGLHPRLERALRFLQLVDPAKLPVGRQEIAGEQVFALVQEYDTKLRSAGFWEAHRKYMDVQYVVSGEELMGYAPLAALTSGPYDAEKDFCKLEGEGQFLRLPAGFFVVMAPQDAHMPGLAVDAPAPARKVVVKVLI